MLVDWLPWNHTFGGNHNFGLVLRNGGTLYIDDGKPTPGRIDETVRNLREIAPTVYFNVPKGFETLVAASAQPTHELAREFLQPREVPFYAGAALPQHVWDGLDGLADQETSAARVPMLSGLGATETAPFGDRCHSRHAGAPAMIGVPIAGHGAETGARRRQARSARARPERHARLLAPAGHDRAGVRRRRLLSARRRRDFVDPARPRTRASIFDGRIAEDFKLSTGTWVSVGPLRARIIAACDPLCAGRRGHRPQPRRDRLLIFPRLAAAARWPGLPADEFAARRAATRRCASFSRGLIDGSGGAGTGSATRVARAVVLAEPPSIDRGEVTDKGSINQRAVLEHRDALVEELYVPVGRPCDPQRLNPHEGNHMNIQGQAALVTGGASGLARGSRAALAQRGREGRECSTATARAPAPSPPTSCGRGTALASLATSRRPTARSRSASRRRGPRPGASVMNVAGIGSAKRIVGRDGRRRR